VTFIGLQLLGSISLLSGNEPHVSSNIHEIKNVGGKNLKDLKIEIINSNLERGDYQLYFTFQIINSFYTLLLMFKCRFYNA
jgi:hypothetical protein